MMKRCWKTSSKGFRSRIVVTIHDAVYVEAIRGRCGSGKTLDAENDDHQLQRLRIPLEVDIK
jgi:hypothetical protein